MSQDKILRSIFEAKKIVIKECSRHGGNTYGHKCVGNTEGKGLLGGPGAHWRILLKPRNMLYGAGPGVRRRNFMHTAMDILQCPCCT
jgi:hypothetical protein